MKRKAKVKATFMDIDGYPICGFEWKAGIEHKCYLQPGHKGRHMCCLLCDETHPNKVPLKQRKK